MNNNILFLINNLKIGGAENVFIKQFLYFKNKGIRVKMAVLSGDDFYKKNIDRILINQQDLFFTNYKGVINFAAYFRLLEYIKKNKINIIYSTLDKANVVAAILKLFCPSLKIVKRESGMAYRKSWKMKLADIIFNLFCYKVIAVSEEVQSSLIAYQLIYKNKIVVLENGVEVKLSSQEIEEIINQKRGNIFKILNVGSMNNDNKGQIGLVNLIAKLRKKNVDCLLYLVGGGKLEKKIKNEAEKLGVGDYVKFIGIINQKELECYYKTCDLFILNSKNEGCPNVVLEAMSYGLLVAASNVGGVNNMIEDSVSGYIFKHNDLSRLGEIIESIINDKDLQKKIAYNGYQRVKEKFLFENKCEELIVLLK